MLSWKLNFGIAGDRMAIGAEEIISKDEIVENL